MLYIGINVMLYQVGKLLSYFALQKSRSGDVPSMMQCFPETIEIVIPVLPDISLKQTAEQLYYHPS